jgi:hypothetical protein
MGVHYAFQPLDPLKGNDKSGRQLILTHTHRHIHPRLLFSSFLIIPTSPHDPLSPSFQHSFINLPFRARRMVFLSEPALPTSAPIKSFKDLLDWKPGQDEYNVAHTPFHPRPRPFARRAGLSSEFSKTAATTPGLSDQAQLRDCKVIVCHDMAGGKQHEA